MELTGSTVVNWDAAFTEVGNSRETSTKSVTLSFPPLPRQSHAIDRTALGGEDMCLSMDR
jgi:hypothetical protein